MLTLALAKGYGPYGWGICSENLICELSKKTDVWVVPENQTPGRVKGKVFHAIAGMTFEPVHHVSGDYNAGYCFFEMDVLAETIKNARSFNHIFCGSTYNMKILEKCDIFHTSLLIQGVDPEIFAPAPPRKPDGKFIIFSGGKFEFRKGQDLVLAAFKALMDKYPDMHLVTQWQNPWPESVMTMTHTKHIDFNTSGGDWKQTMASLCENNGIPPDRITHCELCKQDEASRILEDTDIGIFPNRCEGGTNLVLMEYMAKQRPVIAANNTGHMDVVNDENAILLHDHEVHHLKPYENLNLTAHWCEPSLDELISKIEWAYNNRDELEKYGAAAATSMREFTWERSADTVLEHMTNPEIDKPDYLSQRHMLGNMLTSLGYTGEGAEVGVYSGTLSRFIYARWLGNKLHLVDRWKETVGYHDICNQAQDIQDKLREQVYEIFNGNDDVNIIHAESLDAAKQFEDGQLDWVYIDADHSYKAVKADIEAWYPKVRTGGLVAGDDYIDSISEIGTFGVKSAVDEFVAKNGYELKLSADKKNPNRSWYFIK